MTGKNRSRRSVLPKLAMAFLFVLAALVPSLASARNATKVPYKVVICDPNPQTCNTYTGSSILPKIDAEGMPDYLFIYCSGNPPYCTTGMQQQWEVEPYTGMENMGLITQPGTWNVCHFPTPGGLYFQCMETNNYEDYECAVGTGGPGWSWTMTVYYE
jgi:hypothetical protein